MSVLSGNFLTSCFGEQMWITGSDLEYGKRQKRSGLH